MARAYQHQHFAEAPRGWRVRSKRTGDHVLRVAFPPGRRRRGTGRLLEILHPKENPACESGECAIAQNPAEELLIFGNPADPQAHEKLFDCPHCKEKFTPAEVEEGKFVKHMAEHRGQRFGNALFGKATKANLAWARGYSDGAHGRRQRSLPQYLSKYQNDYAQGYEAGKRKLESKPNAGEYVKAMADRLEAQYREKRREGQGHEEAMTSVIARAGADAKTIREFKRRIGNPGGIGYHKPGCKCAFCKHAGKVRKMVEKMPKPIRDVFDRNPSPAKAVKLYRRMVDMSLPYKERQRLRMRLARINAKMGWTMADVAARARGANPGSRTSQLRRRKGSSPRRRRNPGELEGAQRLFKIFHGRDPQEIATEHRSAAMRSEYTTLGDLEYLIVEPPDKPAVKITFDDDDGVKLASAANGRQLYVIGGNQNLDAMLPKFTEDPRKDFIDLGEGVEVQYLARKIHGNFQPVEWFHKFGRERGQPLDGERPRLMYDKLKKEIFFVGGEYFIDTNVAISPGIEN